MNDSVKSVLSSFVFYYPFFMSYFWIVGGLLHFFLFEQGRKHRATLLPRVPRVAIVVPCYNEGRECGRGDRAPGPHALSELSHHRRQRRQPR